MRDHAHQDPDLVQPESLPVAAELVGEGVDAQAVVRRREGRDVAGEERRADDDVWLWWSKEREIAGCGGVGLAIVVRVSRAVEVELKLSGSCHAEESDASVERKQRWRSQGDTGRNICQERRCEVMVERVFEECYVCRTWGRGLGVSDHGLEGGRELVEKINHVIGVLSAIDHVVIVLQHHVHFRYGFLRLALTCICGSRGRASFLIRQGNC